jgi:hypothetical protein
VEGRGACDGNLREGRAGVSPPRQWKIPLHGHPNRGVSPHVWRGRVKACLVQCQPLSDYGSNPLEPIDIETKVSLLYDEFVSRAHKNAQCNLILGPIFLYPRLGTSGIWCCIQISGVECSKRPSVTRSATSGSCQPTETL